MSKKQKQAPQPKWEIEFDKCFSESSLFQCWDTCREDLIKFITKLLAQEDHDHEILVNSILEVKNDEINKLKKIIKNK